MGSHRKIVPRKYNFDVINKYTYKNILKDETEGDYIFLSDYEGARKPIKVKHLKCGLEFESTPERMISSGERCKCEKFERFKQEVLDNYGFEPYEFLSPFLGNSKKLTVRCKNCGKVQEYSHACNILYITKGNNYTVPPCACYKNSNKTIKTKLVEQKKEEEKAKPKKDNVKTYQEKLFNLNPKVICLENVHDINDSYRHVCLTCNNIWSVKGIDMLKGESCPKCKSYQKNFIKSQNEQVETISKDDIKEEIRKFIKEKYEGSIIEDDISILGNDTLDFYFPDLNKAISIDDNYECSSLFKPTNYHLKRSELCSDKGVQLIHIFSSDYVTNKNILLSKIKHIIQCDSDLPKVYARKCYVEEIDASAKKRFLDANHIQGSDSSAVKLGLWYPTESGDEVLVSVMTFCKPRKALGQSKDSKYDYELSRFANDIEYRVIGSFGKLFKYFRTHYPFDSLITYADRKWSVGGIYENNGFELSHESKPNYWYFRKGNENRLYYRFSFRKGELKKKFPDIYKDELTEAEIMKEAGYLRLYDCGNLVYIFNNKNN
jgi:predicted  nucleic acid-binding Zn-ribbon protein